jgi:hypothetical protein
MVLCLCGCFHRSFFNAMLQKGAAKFAQIWICTPHRTDGDVPLPILPAALFPSICLRHSGTLLSALAVELIRRSLCI